MSEKIWSSSQKNKDVFFFFFFFFFLSTKRPQRVDIQASDFVASFFNRMDDDSLFFGLVRLDKLGGWKNITLQASMVIIYCIYYLLNELLFKTMHFSFANSYVFFQYVFLSLCSYAEMTFPNSPSSAPSSTYPSVLPTKRKSHKSPTKSCPDSVFFFLSVLTISPQMFNYLSLLYLPLPLWVMAKSLRLVWVMMTGMLFFQKKYDRKSYVACICVCIGIALFTYGYRGDKGKKAIENVQQVASDCPLDGRETNLSHTNSATASPLPPSPSPSPFSSFFLPSFLSPTILYGIFLSLVSLSLSSFKSNYQEYIFSRYHLPPTETIFYSHLYGALLLLPLLLLSGEFLEAGMTILGDFNIFWNVLLSFMLHYMGVVVVLTLTKLSGTFSVSIVSSCRKMLTVGLSCVLFSRAFPLSCFFGTLLVFGGIFISSSGKGSKPTRIEMEVILL